MVVTVVSMPKIKIKKKERNKNARDPNLKFSASVEILSISS